MGKLNLKNILIQRGISPEERRGVLEDLFVFGKDNQTPYLVRMSILMVLSTVIASAGLLSDSAAVVIGAMLVAPMMNPVMAAAGSAGAYTIARKESGAIPGLARSQTAYLQDDALQISLAGSEGIMYFEDK